VLVEFVGLPGSGKSTIAHALADLLREHGATVSEPTWRIDHTLRPSLRLLRKASLAIAAAARDPYRARGIIESIVQSRQPTTREVLKLVINALYVAEAAERCERRPGVHVFDQGLLQQLWSALYRAAESSDLEARCRESLALGSTLANVVVVDAPLVTLQRRLQVRRGGASRLERQLRDSGPQAVLERAVFAQQRVEAVVESLSERGTVRLLRVSGGEEASPRLVARAVRDWLA
jgi:energy-coupling factor transporter ATP-binding protein EcfA2